jgi:hypothetical protein
MAKAKKYYKRQKADGRVIYVDESGQEVPEAVAKTNLVMRVNLTESTGRVRAYPSLEKQLHDMSAENRKLREKLKLRESASTVKERKERLQEGFKRLGLSEAESRIAARGR